MARPVAETVHFLICLKNRGGKTGSAQTWRGSQPETLDFYHLSRSCLALSHPCLDAGEVVRKGRIRPTAAYRARTRGVYFSALLSLRVITPADPRPVSQENPLCRVAVWPRHSTYPARSRRLARHALPGINTQPPQPAHRSRSPLRCGSYAAGMEGGAQERTESLRGITAGKQQGITESRPPPSLETCF